MASVRLNGDTSGFIEISAPNVAGSTTITLPATSGGNFLVTDSNGDLNVDSGTLFVDASTNRVGIGTTSPVSHFHVDGTGSVTMRVSSSDNSLFIQAGASGGSTFHEYKTLYRIVDTDNGERARFDSSGRLLVGTNTARTNFNNATDTTHLQVEGTNANTSSLALICNNGGGVPVASVHLAKSDGGSVGSNGRVGGQWNVGDIRFSGNDGAQFVEAARIEAEIDGTPAANDMPGRLIFSTTASGAAAPTERMRIGNLGTTQIVSRPNNVTLQLRYVGSPDTGNDIQQVFRDAGIDSGVLCCRIRSDGNLQNTNGSYTQISDAKLKENIVDANSQWDDIKGIRIRNWNFKEETGNLTHKQIGPIAQELEEVCPNLVFDTPDKDEEGNDLGTVTKGVNQSVLYMKAVKALQEAMERIETLETANASLEARLTALEGGN